MKLIKSNGIDIEVKENQWLLTVRFRDLDDTSVIAEDKFSWMPQWQTIRDLMLSAAVVEMINSKYPGEEITKFRDTFKDTTSVIDTIISITMGQLGIED